MHDNKVRLSQDVLEKAEQIAAEWGLKNTRAAVEAVFRRYADEYRYGREPFAEQSSGMQSSGMQSSGMQSSGIQASKQPIANTWTASRSMEPIIVSVVGCEAMDALDDLLGA